MPAVPSIPFRGSRALLAALAATLLGLVLGLPAAVAGPTSPDTPFVGTGKVSRDSAAPGEKVELRYTVHVHDGHYIYREATSVEISDPGGLLVGAPRYPTPAKHFDKFENKEAEVYDKTVTFTVPATVPRDAAPGKTLAAKAVLRYRGCNATTCFFPKTDEIELAVRVGAAARGAVAKPLASPIPAPAGAAPTVSSPGTAVAAGTPSTSPPAASTAGAAPGTTGTPSPATENPADAPAAATTLTASAPPTASAVTPTSAPPVAAGPSIAAASVPASPAPAAQASVGERLKAWADGLSRTNFPMFLLIVFLGGLASSLTPCVYPMIPITVGVIGARSQNSRFKGFVLSLFYVAGIAVTYSALGAVAAATGGLVGSAFQNPFVITGIAAFFFLLALGMFGVYNLALPSGVMARLSNVQGEGYVGAFLVGLVGGVVCSPCVGPVAGLILGYMAQGSFSMAQGLVSMMVFSLGLGMLFLVVGTFSSVIAALPRSGAWMERVKYVFGFLMVGVAVYYLSFVVPAAVTAALFAVVLLLAGVTLGGLEPLPEEAGWGPRFSKSFALLLLTAGLVSVFQAVFGSRLGGIEDRLAGLERRPVATLAAGAAAPSSGGIAWVRSEPEGATKAKADGRPMMIDFTAEWCVACKELEHYTFTDPKVIDAASRYVAVSVDCTEGGDPEVEAVKRRYGVVSLPTIVFVDASGAVRHDLTVKGFMKADEFLQRMHAAMGGSTARLGASAGG